jgi:hypothetical protein
MASARIGPNDAHHSAAVEILEDASPPLLVHPITAAEVLVAAVRNDVADAVWADLMAIGVEIDDTAIDPLLLAFLCFFVQSSKLNAGVGMGAYGRFHCLQRELLLVGPGPFERALQDLQEFRYLPRAALHRAKIVDHRSHVPSASCVPEREIDNRSATKPAYI